MLVKCVGDYRIAAVFGGAEWSLMSYPWGIDHVDYGFVETRFVTSNILLRCGVMNADLFYDV